VAVYIWALLAATINASSTGANIDESKSTAIGGAIGGAAAIGFIIVTLYVVVQLMRESPMSSMPYRSKWPIDPLHYIEIFVYNKLCWVVLLQILAIVGFAISLTDDRYSAWTRAASGGLTSTQFQLYLFGLLKMGYLGSSRDYSPGAPAMMTMCQASMPVCPYVCEGTGKAATALLAFALIFIVVSMLFVIKRLLLGDSMVYYKVTYPLCYLAAIYAFIAIGLHGGWCFAEIDNDLKGTGIEPKHYAGFGAAVGGMLAAIWAGVLSGKFTYLTYAPTTGGTGTTAI